MAYTATSIDVFIAAYAGCLGGMRNLRGVSQNTSPAHYAHIAQVALAFAEAFDTEYAAILPNDLQLAEIETICSEQMAGKQPGGVPPTTAAFWTKPVLAIIALLSEADAVVAANVTNPIPFPSPPSGIPVVQIATVVGTSNSLMATVPATGIVAMVDGYKIAGDGGSMGGYFWSPTSTETHNGGTVLNPTGHVGAGRWIGIVRNGGTLVNARWFGARGDFEMYGNGQDATAGNDQVPWRAFASIDGELYVGKDIGIEGAGVAGADYFGVITAYNPVTHNWTVVPTPSTTVVDAANLYATRDTAAVEAARTYANTGVGTFYPAGYDLRPAQVYLSHGSFWIPEGITGAPVGFYCDNATIWGDYRDRALFTVNVGLSGPFLHTGLVARGYKYVIKCWAATFDGLQTNWVFDHPKFQDCRYVAANAACGNFFLTLIAPELENSGIAIGFFAACHVIDPEGTSFGAVGSIFTAAAALGDFTDGSILVGGTVDGILCPNAVGSLIHIVGGNLSPLVNTMTGAVDGQAWIIARRITSLVTEGLRLGGESGGLPLLRLEEEADPVNDGSADASSISIGAGTICVSSNLPAIVFDDAAPLRYVVSEDSEIGNFGEVGMPVSFTQTAYNKLAHRSTNWAQVALNKVGTVGNINNASILKQPLASYPSSAIDTLARMYRDLEYREYPARNADISGNVYDDVINVSNVTVTDTTILGLPAKKIVSTDGVTNGQITLVKYFPDGLVPHDATVVVPYAFKGNGLTTCQVFAWNNLGPVPGPSAIKDTNGQPSHLSYEFYYDGNITNHSHSVQYLIIVPPGAGLEVVLGPASLLPGKYGGQLVPAGGAPIPPFFLHGSATWNPGNIAVGGSETKAITVTGAVVGDKVIGVSFGLDPQGVTLTANVTAPDTVTAVLANNTAGAVNLDVGTISVDVYHSAAPFDPASLSGMVFRVRASENITLAGGFVSGWGDQAEVPHNLVNANVGLQPLFVAAGRNGRPCVRSDGVDDFLTTATGANVVGAGPYTMVVVMQDATGVGATIALDYGTGTLANGFAIIINGGNQRSIPHIGVLDHVDAAATTDAEVWVSTASNAAVALRVNGANQALTNAGSPAMTNPGANGRITLFKSLAGAPWAGDIYEVILYNRALSASEIAQVEGYANEWYALY